METTESILGTSSRLTPRLIRVDTTDVASLLAVSMEATAPTLFMILTSSSDPPWHSMVSVSNTCRGMLHERLVVKRRTHIEYTCLITLGVIFESLH